MQNFETYASSNFHFSVPSIIGVFVFAIALPLLIRATEK